MKTTSVFLVLAILSGCTKPAPEKVEQQIQLTGRVLLADEGQLFVDPSGMIVAVENSNPVISATSNQLGDFRIAIPGNLSSFALVYSKPRYGTFKRFFERRGDTLYALAGGEYETATTLLACGDGSPGWGYENYESLGYKSTVTVNSLTSRVVGNKLFINCNISSLNATTEKYVRFFYQKNNPNLTYATVPKTTKNMGMPYPVKNGDNYIEMCISCLYQCADIKSGETIYITAYGDSFYSNLYKEKSTNTFMMPNINLSNNASPVSFVLP